MPGRAHHSPPAAGDPFCRCAAPPTHRATLSLRRPPRPFDIIPVPVKVGTQNVLTDKLISHSVPLCVRSGSAIVAGKEYGRVRSIRDARGESVESVGPSEPAEVSGLRDVPSVGDVLQARRDPGNPENVHHLENALEAALVEPWQHTQHADRRSLYLLCGLCSPPGGGERGKGETACGGEVEAVRAASHGCAGCTHTRTRTPSHAGYPDYPAPAQLSQTRQLLHSRERLMRSVQRACHAAGDQRCCNPSAHSSTLSASLCGCRSTGGGASRCASSARSGQGRRRGDGGGWESGSGRGGGGGSGRRGGRGGGGGGRGDPRARPYHQVRRPGADIRSGPIRSLSADCPPLSLVLQQSSPCKAKSPQPPRVYTHSLFRPSDEFASHPLPFAAQGTGEALKLAVEGLGSELVGVNVVSCAVGPVTESDVSLAAATGAIVLAYNVKVTASEAVRGRAERLPLWLWLWLERQVSGS